MNKLLVKVFSLIMVLALMLMSLPMQPALAAAGSLVGLYAQNFNSLASSPSSNTWLDDSTLPSWYSNRTVYLAGTGSNNAGGLYSFGSSTAPTDRALGSIASGSTGTIFYGVRFVNDTGGVVTQLNVSYTGEQWRNGGSSSAVPSIAQTLDFQYQVGATSITGGTWIDFNALDFTSPIFGTTAASALDGNAAANHVVLNASITSLTILPNQEVWLRWQDVNDPNNDHGLAVDNLSITVLSNPLDPAPTVSSTTPAGDATDVLLTDNVIVTFSEPVNVSGNWFQLVCPTSGTRSVADTTVTGGPTSFTIDPSAEFANSETCTLTIFAAQVTDLDTNDPDDAMVSNYITSFTTIGPDNAPAVASTIPADGATNVPINQSVVVNFTEPVNVTDPWFTLTCATSGAHAAAVTGGPTSFTLNPTVDFVYGELCTLVIDATKVSDQDNNDPPNNMVFNFTAGFTTEVDPCTLPYTPVYQIQGSGPAAAVTGVVTTQGVVVGDYEGASPTLRGFYLQDLNGDGDAATSDGIFIFNGNNNSVSLGDVVRVTGTASEFQDQTQISASSTRKCGINSVAPVDVTFPVPSSTYLEQYEGMLVRLPQTMYVTEHFQLGRFGQVVLSANGKLKQPTNVVYPGAAANALQAQNNLNKIILDDALQNQNPDPILFGRDGLPLSASNTLRGGDTATSIIGVMTYTWAGNAASGNAYRVRPITALGGYINFDPSNPRPASVPEVGGTVKVVGMNLLNFFNTFADNNTGTPGCFPSGTDADCRGANSVAEFTRQYQKTVAAILAMNPDVLGVNELENDGYGPTSAIQFLVNQLNAATAPGTYAFIDVDANTGQANALGTDAIKVALLYKPGVVTPIGQTAPLNTVAFVNGGDASPRNRVSLAQAFQLNSNGAVFIVDANHLKSKGSACDAPDAFDGQGNCNQVRVNAVTELMNWFATDPTGTGDPDVLMIGDYNSYAMEDPITVIKNAGFTNLIEAFLGPDAYSYVFDGQWGYLDHALGSASLASQVTGVGDYHINSDEPSVLDYNVEFKSAGQVASLYAPDQFRISDHDPVVIGLCTPPTLSVSVSPNSLWPPNHKYKTVEAAFASSSDTASVTLLSVTSNEPDDGLGDGDTANDIVVVDNDTIQLRAERSGNGPGRIYTITYQATNTCGATVTATATVSVPHNK